MTTLALCLLLTYRACGSLLHSEIQELVELIYVLLKEAAKGQSLGQCENIPIAETQTCFSCWGE